MKTILVLMDLTNTSSNAITRRIWLLPRQSSGRVACRSFELPVAVNGTPHFYHTITCNQVMLEDKLKSIDQHGFVTTALLCKGQLQKL